MASVGSTDPGGGADNAPPGLPRAEVEALLPIVRRVVRARVANPAVAEDVVQETVARVLAAAERVDPSLLEPYAIATARNIITSLWKEQARHRRNQHRVVDLVPVELPDDRVQADEDRTAMARALQRLPERDRRLLMAHEVTGTDTRSLAADAGSTPGAVAAQLNRSRARLRVEYLLALEPAPPPTELCRPVLLALSGGDRRRQREIAVGRHLIECAVCARLSEPLLQRGQPDPDRERVPVRADADIVAVRRAARETAARMGFGHTDQTIIATAVSEIARNIVRFAGSGEVEVQSLERPARGIRVIARDGGPGIADIDRALRDGYSTYSGLGLGLPGARRLMDEFDIASVVGRGTTVTLTKWLGKG